MQIKVYPYTSPHEYKECSTGFVGLRILEVTVGYTPICQKMYQICYSQKLLSSQLRILVQI